MNRNINNVNKRFRGFFFASVFARVAVLPSNHWKYLSSMFLTLSLRVLYCVPSNARFNALSRRWMAFSRVWPYPAMSFGVLNLPAGYRAIHRLLFES